MNQDLSLDLPSIELYKALACVVMSKVASRPLLGVLPSSDWDSRNLLAELTLDRERAGPVANGESNRANSFGFLPIGSWEPFFIFLVA